MAQINSAMPAAILNLQRIEKKFPVARDVMYTCAFIHAIEIPYEVITESIPRDYRFFPQGKDRSWIIKEVLPMLVGYYMMRLDQAESLAWVHESTSTLVRADMSPHEKLSHLTDVLGAMDRLFPEQQTAVWAKSARLYPHARVLLRHAVQYKLGATETAMSLRKKACTYLESRGRLNDAAALNSELS